MFPLVSNMVPAVPIQPGAEVTVHSALPEVKTVALSVTVNVAPVTGYCPWK